MATQKQNDSFLSKEYSRRDFLKGMAGFVAAFSFLGFLMPKEKKAETVKVAQNNQAAGYGASGYGM